MNIYILGIDGLGRGVLEYQPKNISALLKQSTLYENMYTVFEPSSAQGWGSLLLSVPADKHGYTYDMISEYVHEFDEFPSLFRVVSETLKDYEMCAISNWNPINTGILENIDRLVKKTSKLDTEIADMAVDFINNSGDNSLLFVQLDELDEAGHTHDYFTQEYFNEFAKVDENLGKILNAIEKSGKLEDSAIFIVTDHGGGAKPKSHGLNHIKDMGIFAIACGGAFERGKVISEQVSIMDIAPTVLKILGVNSPDSFEGKSLI